MLWCAPSDGYEPARSTLEEHVSRHSRLLVELAAEVARLRSDLDDMRLEIASIASDGK